jgi:hypothetical protein
MVNFFKDLDNLEKRGHLIYELIRENDDTKSIQ